jgi:NadR type nicotinamide-nucleotide adenylyltransferase
MKRIAITGPESTGKTMLAQQLAEHFQTVWVPEFARTYLDARGGAYAFEDILHIAQGQLREEERMLPMAVDFLFCDTCFLVCKVWSDVRFGRTDPWITEALTTRPYDLYIVPQPDFEWVADPLRAHPQPEDRWALLQRYRDELTRYGRTWTEVSGSPKERFDTAMAAVETLR